ncbi:UDP-N-acetylmuramoyl-tripeptide--D-alanyl-D-alanine ligase [Thiospirochaeta perfilievii]|uniref:UDP-N-acetylmuramoyl-tripeptide--D-alanyl-D-alanine ligase n=1 Tax=Thiospirochaeta perfilievii TaxID=252967 RepID=A0A5C1Q8Q6_9SPIO|nr:UDP-N-acetylmuramoyl-tripeptide--D-alanyl-D-alanine ligase [Thiospirochaeta perfilievii]QEN03748.1 UDP-N-acetylmuramoyl-tripeptide--D-alanyl-D-alanine ligase [Thiospirochaeta perfilievii]
MIELFSHYDILNALEAKAVGYKDGVVDRVIIDSRLAVGGSLFIPLKGEFTDGNLYIEECLKKGVVSSLVSSFYFDKNREMIEKLAAEYGATFFIVNDGLEALHKLAHHYIEKFPKLKVISITGSSGKTTTKEVLGSILKLYKPTLVTDGNFNSETGLPLTVFRVREENELAVLEMGMSNPGEIKALVDIINPDISIITNIGTAHIGSFGSRDGIAREKKDSFANFTGDNIGIIPGWDDYYSYLSSEVNGSVLTVSDNPDFISNINDLGFYGWEFKYEDVTVKYPYIGRYNLLNAFMAISCARELGVPSRLIAQGLENLPSMFGRGEVLNGKNWVIRDCYNANPDSMLSSLKMFESTKWDKEKVVILGSMLELGDSSYLEHNKILNFARDRFKTVILCGKEFEQVFSELESVVGIHYFKDVNDLKNRVDVLVGSGSLVLLKASRGIGLEGITDNLL